MNYSLFEASIWVMVGMCIMLIAYAVGDVMDRRENAKKLPRMPVEPEELARIAEQLDRLSHRVAGFAKREEASKETADSAA